MGAAQSGGMAVSKSDLYADISARIETTTSTMAEAGYDALVVYGNTEVHGSIRYLSDYVPDHGTTMVTADGTINVTDGAALLLTPDDDPTLMIEPGLVVPHEVHTEHIVAGGWDPNSLALTADSLVELLEGAGVTSGTVGIENLSRFPHPLYAGVDAGLPDVDLVESRIVEEQRATKTAVELEIVREGCGLAERVHEIVVEELSDYAGKTELDVALAVETTLIEENPEYTTKKGPAYLNSGEGISTARYYHPRGTQELTEGSAFTWDFPQHYRGYYVDTSRTRVLGEPTDEQRRGFEAARQAYDEVIDMARPGAHTMDLVNRYHEILGEAGFEAPFGGLLGHGVGLEIHERPDLVVDEMVLEEDMVLAIEPRSLVGDSVVGLEDMIRVTDSGGEVLTGFDRETLAI